MADGELGEWGGGDGWGVRTVRLEMMGPMVDPHGQSFLTYTRAKAHVGRALMRNASRVHAQLIAAWGSIAKHKAMQGARRLKANAGS